MDEDRVLDDNSRYGILQILNSVVFGVCVGLIFYLLMLLISPFIGIGGLLFGLLFGFAASLLFEVFEPLFIIEVLLLLLLSPGVGGLIGGYIGYKTGLGIRLCTSIGAIVFSLLLIIILFFFS